MQVREEDEEEGDDACMDTYEYTHAACVRQLCCQGSMPGFSRADDETPLSSDRFSDPEVGGERRRRTSIKSRSWIGCRERSALRVI